MFPFKLSLKAIKIAFVSLPGPTSQWSQPSEPVHSLCSHLRAYDRLCSTHRSRTHTFSFTLVGISWNLKSVFSPTFIKRTIRLEMSFYIEHLWVGSGPGLGWQLANYVKRRPWGASGESWWCWGSSLGLGTFSFLHGDQVKLLVTVPVLNMGVWEGSPYKSCPQDFVGLEESEVRNSCFVQDGIMSIDRSWDCEEGRAWLTLPGDSWQLIIWWIEVLFFFSRGVVFWSPFPSLLIFIKYRGRANPSFYVKSQSDEFYQCESGGVEDSQHTSAVSPSRLPPRRRSTRRT